LKRKIIHLLYSGLGGHGSDFFSIVKGDAQRVYDTEAFFCGIEPVLETYREKCQQAGIPYQSFLKRRGADFGVWKDLYRAFRKARPSVIVLYTLSLIIPAALYRLFNPKVKLIVRDTQAHHLKTAMEWRWLRIAVGRADKVVVLSEASALELNKRYSSEKIRRKTVVIPNGIDTDFYSPGFRKHYDPVVIGMQSRLQPIKDHPTLFQAFAALKQASISPGFELHIAGDGPTMSQLVTLSEKLRIGVNFAGMLDEPALLSFMQELNIYVHATFGEMMSTSIMQAMACGLPVVASDVWGVNNMIVDGETGLLYKSADPGDLLAKLKLLTEDPAKADSIAAAARVYAIREFSVDTLFKRYDQLFSE